MTYKFWSTLTYDGMTAPTSPFSTLDEDNQFIGMPTLEHSEIGEKESTESWLITAGASDLYIIPVTTNQEPDSYAGMNCIFVHSDTVKEINDLNLKGVKFLNVSGTEYLIEVLVK